MSLSDRCGSWGSNAVFPRHGCELSAHNPSVLGDFGSHEWLVTRAGSGGVSLTSPAPRSGVRILRGCLQGLKAAACISSRPQGTGPTAGTRNTAVHIREPLSLGQPFPSWSGPPSLLQQRGGFVPIIRPHNPPSKTPLKETQMAAPLL